MRLTHGHPPHRRRPSLDWCVVCIVFGCNLGTRERQKERESKSVYVGGCKRGVGGLQGSGCLFSRPLFESIVFRQLRFFMRETIWRVLSECRAAAVFWGASFMDHRPGVGWWIQTQPPTLLLLPKPTTPTFSNPSSSPLKPPLALEALPHNTRWRVAQRDMKRARECCYCALLSITRGTVLHPEQCFHEVCEDPFVRQTQTLNSVLKHKPQNIAQTYWHLWSHHNNLMCEWTFDFFFLTDHNKTIILIQVRLEEADYSRASCISPEWDFRFSLAEQWVCICSLSVIDSVSQISNTHCLPSCYQALLQSYIH